MDWMYGVLGLVLLFIGLAFFISAKQRIKAIMILLARYVNIPNSPIDPATGLSLLWFPFLLREKWQELARSALATCIVLLAVAQAVSLMWSSQKFEGLREFAYTMAVLAAFLAFSQPTAIVFARRVFAVIVPLLVVSVCSIILFRLFPNIELSYLRSSPAQFLIGPEAPQLFQGRPNNVLLEERAAGLFFVNSNRASMVLGVHAMLFLALSQTARHPLGWRLISGMLLLGVFATGSKTGLVLGTVLTFCVLVILAERARRRTIVLFSTLGAFSLGLYLWVDSKSAVDVSAYSDSWADRLPMWNAAASFLARSPITGLGFGGWAQEWSKVFWLFGKPASFPPHNLLIANYSDSGLLGFLATLGIGVVVVGHLCRTLKLPTVTGEDREHRAIYAWASASLVWAYVHSLGDNTNFYGVAMTVGAYACAMVLVRQPGRRAKNHGSTLVIQSKSRQGREYK